MTFAVD
jgi:hypothetical protein